MKLVTVISFKHKFREYHQFLNFVSDIVSDVFDFFVFLAIF